VTIPQDADRADVFIKIIADPRALARELNAYRLGLPMLPKLLDFIAPDTLHLQKIAGGSYLDQWESDTPALIGDAIARFHHATYDGAFVLCHWDNQPQNILIADGRVFLVDFEDSCPAPPEADITHLLLFWAAQWEFQTFIHTVNCFLQTYTAILPLHTELWREYLPQSIERFDLRRATYRPDLPLLKVDQKANRSYLEHIHFSNSLSA